MLIYYDIKIERAALGRTILNGMQRLQARLQDPGDSYLLPDEDPWQIDDKRTGTSQFKNCPSCYLLNVVFLVASISRRIR